MQTESLYTPEQFDEAASAATQALALRASPSAILKMLHGYLDGVPYGLDFWTRPIAQKYASKLQNDWKLFAMQHFTKLDGEQVSIHFDENKRAIKARENARMLFVAKLCGIDRNAKAKATRQKIASVTHLEQEAEAGKIETPNSEAPKLTAQESALVAWFRATARGNRAVIDAAANAHRAGQNYALMIEVAPIERDEEPEFTEADVAELRALAAIEAAQESASMH